MVLDQKPMNPYAKLKRKWLPKRYVTQGLRRAEEAYQERLKAAPLDKRNEIRSKGIWEIWEWMDWVKEIEDAELVAEATKVGVRLDDIPAPYSEKEARRSHYETGDFGNRLLHHETRLALRTQIRELGPAFRKERRENIELFIKILTLMVGLVGGVTGLVALLMK